MKRLLRLWLVFLFIAAGYTVVVLARPLLSGEEIRPGHVLGAAAAGLLVSAGILGIVHWQQARDRKMPISYPTPTRFRSAVSRGRLPKDADPEPWRRELSKVIRLERHVVWAGPLIFGAFAALGIFLIADNPGQPWFWAFCTIVFAGLAIWAPFSIVRHRRKVESLLFQLTAPPRDS